MIDRMKDGALTWDSEVFGYSSGVLGIQLFPNKRFDSKAWSLKKYLDDPAAVEPPYLAGLSCVYCHVSFNPNRPPSNPGEPKWENLDSNIGNQYLREGITFGGYEAPHDSFLWQYLANQEPGTSETSRLSADFINGPIHMNSIYRLNERLKLAKPERITAEQYVMMKSIYKHVGLPEDTAAGALGGTPAEP